MDIKWKVDTELFWQCAFCYLCFLSSQEDWLNRPWYGTVVLDSQSLSIKGVTQFRGNCKKKRVYLHDSNFLKSIPWVCVLRYSFMSVLCSLTIISVDNPHPPVLYPLTWQDHLGYLCAAINEFQPLTSTLKLIGTHPCKLGTASDYCCL